MACVVGSGGALIRQFRDGLEEAILDRQRLLVENRALTLRENVTLASRELEGLAALSEMDLRDPDLEPERQLLAHAYRQTPFFNSRMELYGPSGECLWTEPRRMPCAAATDEIWFREALRPRHEARAYAIEDEDDERVLLAAPVVRDGAVLGVLGGVVDLHGDLVFSPPLRDEIGESTAVALVGTGGARCSVTSKDRRSERRSAGPRSRGCGADERAPPGSLPIATRASSPGRP